VSHTAWEGRYCRLDHDEEDVAFLDEGVEGVVGGDVLSEGLAEIGLLQDLRGRVGTSSATWLKLPEKEV
jgi:hypothetical protein